MKRILKREYTAEFKEQAVAMENNGCSLPEVTDELGRFAQTLRNWVKAAKRVVMVIMGGLIVLAQGSAVAPFIYTLF